MNAPVAGTAWCLVGTARTIEGFAFGSRYPVVVATIAGHPLTEAQLAAVTARLCQVLPALEHVSEPPVTAADRRDRFRRSVEWVLATVNRLQRACQVPVYEGGRVLTCRAGQATVALTATGGMLGPSARVMQALLHLMQIQSAPISEPAPLGPIAQALAELQRAGGLSPNVLRFVQAACEMPVPFQALSNAVIQYGIGRRGRWLESSFTDETPHIGAMLSRQKHLAAQTLRRAGIPVPNHALVGSSAAAVRAAESFGYPVVVKPTDRYGGIGVAAGLLSSEEVETAFEEARKHSRNILVEKHFSGRDYRVAVFRGEIIAAIERVPGGVTGDGEHTVCELLDRINADPRRGTDPHAPLKRLVLDAEAGLLLQRAGLHASAVPAQGQFVRLRRVANIATGGTPVAVQEQIHPDNAGLALRAAAALRLDLAGVDLLIADIGRSWRETGAAICEVNAQPNLGQITSAHVYPHILRRLVLGDGRIPIAVVLGADPDGGLVRCIEALLLRDRVAAGCHDAGGVRVNGQTVMPVAAGCHAAGLALCADRSVGTIVLSLNDDSVLRTGLPFSRVDVLVVAGAHILPHRRVPGTPNLAPVLGELLGCILPACDGIVLTIEGSGLALDGFAAMSSARWQHLPADPEAVLAAVVDGLRSAEARHAMAPQQQTALGHIRPPLTASQSAAG